MRMPFSMLSGRHIMPSPRSLPSETSVLPWGAKKPHPIPLRKMPLPTGGATTTETLGKRRAHWTLLGKKTNLGTTLHTGFGQSLQQPRIPLPQGSSLQTLIWRQADGHGSCQVVLPSITGRQGKAAKHQHLPHCHQWQLHQVFLLLLHHPQPHGPSI